MGRLTPVIVAVFIWCGAVSLVSAAQPVATGNAVGVRPTASADLNNISRQLAIGSDVKVGETVVTGPKGQVQLLFNDQTRLVVGPRSSLLIADYLLRKDNSVGQFTVNALGGTFRFITGKSAKDAYLIQTPTGTVGVRGTAFDFNVYPRRTDVVLFHGAVQLCNLAGQCVTLTRQCSVGATTMPKSFTIGVAVQQRDNMREAFRYVRSEFPLRKDFRVPHARSCVPAPSGSDTLAPGTGGSVFAPKGKR